MCSYQENTTSLCNSQAVLIHTYLVVCEKTNICMGKNTYTVGPLKTIKSIKSPHSQFVWSNMNDGIFYTLDGVQVTLRHILKSANHSKPTIDATNNFIFSAIERLEEGGTMKDSWETFNQIQDKYIRME